MKKKTKMDKKLLKEKKFFKQNPTIKEIIDKGIQAAKRKDFGQTPNVKRDSK